MPHIDLLTDLVQLRSILVDLLGSDVNSRSIVEALNASDDQPLGFDAAQVAQFTAYPDHIPPPPIGSVATLKPLPLSTTDDSITKPQQPPNKQQATTTQSQIASHSTPSSSVTDRPKP
jgi:hypothetical protein